MDRAPAKTVPQAISRRSRSSLIRDTASCSFVMVVNTTTASVCANLLPLIEVREHNTSLCPAPSRYACIYRANRRTWIAMPEEALIVRGAREHNLRNIDVTIPRDRLTVITGLSGSGKSSLAFDTIYAEGQRRYVESLSA